MSPLYCPVRPAHSSAPIFIVNVHHVNDDDHYNDADDDTAENKDFLGSG